MFKIYFWLLCGFLIVNLNTGDQGKGTLLKVSSNQAPSKIINGHLTIIEKYPFLVSLQYHGTFLNHSVVHFCCGNIIDAFWIVTAAQCMQSKSINNFHIRAGSSKYFNDGEIYKPAEIIIHPKFVDAYKSFDIALIKLTSNIIFNSKIQPIQLPKPDVAIEDKTLLHIAGWGKVYQTDSLSDYLRETKVAKINKHDCELVYGKGSISDKNFCVYRNGYGPCVGDTGSPAELNGILLGMASWSYSCGYNYPTAYTNISLLSNWIKEVTGVGQEKENLNL